MLQRFYWLIMISVLVTSIGCNPAAEATYPVSGSVTFDGNPVSDGQIYFMDKATGVLDAALPIQNGSYQGLVKAGARRVEIHAYREEGTQIPMPGMDPEPVRVDYIPPQYGSMSELSAEIKPDDTNRFDYELTSTE